MRSCVTILCPLNIVGPGIDISDHIPVFMEMKMQLGDGTGQWTRLAHSESGAGASPGVRSYNLRWDRMVSSIYYGQIRLLFESVKTLSHFYIC